MVDGRQEQDAPIQMRCCKETRERRGGFEQCVEGKAVG